MLKFHFVLLRKDLRLYVIFKSTERALLPSSQVYPTKPGAHSHSKVLYPSLVHVAPFLQGELKHGSGTRELKIILVVISGNHYPVFTMFILHRVFLDTSISSLGSKTRLKIDLSLGLSELFKKCIFRPDTEANTV